MRYEREQTIVFIRHGATKGNLERRYVGTTDEALLSESVQELVTRRSFWQSYMEAAPLLFVSPYLRARQTADILFPRIRQHVIEAYAECNFGAFEYKNYEQLKNHPQYQRYIDSGGEAGFPGGESKTDYTKRVLHGFETMLQQCQRMRESGEIAQPHTIVVVAHGGTIMALLDVLSVPHQDYFSWQVKPGMGVIGILKRNDEKRNRIDVEGTDFHCRDCVSARPYIWRPTVVVASDSGNRVADRTGGAEDV